MRIEVQPNCPQRARRLFVPVSELSMTPTLYDQARPVRYSAKRSSHHVTFSCDAPDAERVLIVGDFNGWNAFATPMSRMPDGRWFTSLELHHGHHRYLFLVDGEPQLDPKAIGIARDDQDNRVSLLAVS